MSLKAKVEKAILDAMKSKESDKLRGLREIKSQLLLLETSGAGNITEEMEMNILQKMSKQRKDSLTIYEEQGREDLAKKERQELEIIDAYLPQQMDESELTQIIGQIISSTGASGMKDMGKIMGLAKQKVGASADGKTLSMVVKKLLS